MKRVELACHTGFSRMNGMGLADEWIDFAMENDIDTLVITDSGCVDSYADFQHYIKRKIANIKLIMGADLLVFDDRDLTGKIIDEGRISVLIRNEEGRNNLYHLLSVGEQEYKDGREMRLPLSLLLENREGLLLGSGADAGLLLKTAKFYNNNNEKTDDENIVLDESLFSFLDYVELPCDGFSDNTINLLCRMADSLDIPAVAVSAPHYMRNTEMDALAHQILHNNANEECRCYRSTEKLLKLFSHEGEEKAYEIVVANSRKIADMCEEVKATVTKKLYPFIENQDEILRDICEKSLPEKYDVITQEIRNRLSWELEAIRTSKSAFMFIQLKEVFDMLKLMPFEVTSRGLVGSSLVAYLCGICEIDPVKAKLSPYFFYGYKGDREPDIDLNFSEDIQTAVHRIYGNVSGVGEIIKAGTFGTISEKYAGGMINNYSEEQKRIFTVEEFRTLVDKLSGCVNTRGQHPGGIIALPQGVTMADICPVSVIDTGIDKVAISAFDYHEIDRVVYKFDALGHSSPQILKKLYDITGVDPRSISLDDPEVMEMFIAKDGELPACAGLPEFNGEFVFGLMKACNCRTFDDLVKLCSLVHGTDVWNGNAEVLFDEGMVGIDEVIADRNDVYDTLISHGMDEETSFSIAEDVRKGKVCRGRSQRWNEWKQQMTEHGIPKWFIWSCEHIRYMFPRAHSYSYIMTSWRLAFYKLHFPEQFDKVITEVIC